MTTKKIVLLSFLCRCLAAEIIQVLVDQIKQSCPDFRQNVYTPTCPFGNFVERNKSVAVCREILVEISFIPQEFQGIDDREEEFRMSGTLIANWKVDEDCESSISHNFNLRVENYGFWQPSIIHSNAIVDFSMKRQFGSRFSLSKHKESMGFELRKLGLFESSCDLDLSRFPFDQQTCTLDFMAHEVSRTLQFKEICETHADIRRRPNQMEISDDVTAGTFWRAIDGWCNSQTMEIAKENRSIVSFTFQLRRIPNDYIFSLFLPSCLLCILDMATLFLPPDSTDRPAISLTIVLAQTFVNTAVSNQTPQKPNRVFLASYVDACGLFCFFCTLYFMIINWIVHHFPNFAKRKTCAEVTGQRQLDIFAFIIALVMYLIINGNAIRVALDI